MLVANTHKQQCVRASLRLSPVLTALISPLLLALIDYGTRRFGWDLHPHPSPRDNSQQCSQQCEREPKCISWSYSTSRWLIIADVFQDISSIAYGVHRHCSQHNTYHSATRALLAGVSVRPAPALNVAAQQP